MVTKWFVFSFILMGTLAACSVDTHHSVSSPDGNITTEVWLDDSGTPQNRINHEDRVVLEDSRLGLIQIVSICQHLCSSSGRASWKPLINSMK